MRYLQQTFLAPLAGRGAGGSGLVENRAKGRAVATPRKKDTPVNPLIAERGVNGGVCEGLAQRGP